jgi:hypothetical protein
MKFATLTLALTAALALNAISAPSFAQSDRRGGGYYDDQRYRDYCHDKKKNGQKGGAVLGAIAGAVIGSNVAGRGAKTEGAVVGGVAGAVVGSNVGRSMGKCDGRGAYWNKGNSYPYRGDYYRQGGGRYDDRYYESRRCRWAEDYNGDRIRVCPDNNGRYRPAY